MTQQQLEIVKKDRMRYKSNNLSSNLCLLAVVFNAIFFVIVFKINQNFTYTILLGVSVLYNLLFMLLAFLASTKVKAYDKTFNFILLALAAGQIVRIFVYPTLTLTNYKADNPNEASIKFTWMILVLVASVVCLVLASVFGILRSTVRTKYLKSVENNEIDLSFMQAAEGGE